jgi:hypothetical protein
MDLLGERAALCGRTQRNSPGKCATREQPASAIIDRAPPLHPIGDPSAFARHVLIAAIERHATSRINPTP